MTHLTDENLKETTVSASLQQSLILSADVVKAAAALPQETPNSASRLGVMIGGKKVLVHLTDISEVLPVPPLQSVPLTKAWYLGVTNVRGNLYSVTDLAQFLQWPLMQKQLSNRIILLNSVKTTQAALLIDAVIGLRNIDSMHLNVDMLVTTQTMLGSSDTHFFSQIYQDQDEYVWLTLDVNQLVQDSRFIQPSLA